MDQALLCRMLCCLGSPSSPFQIHWPPEMLGVFSTLSSGPAASNRARFRLCWHFAGPADSDVVYFALLSSNASAIFIFVSWNVNKQGKCLESDCLKGIMMMSSRCFYVILVTAFVWLFGIFPNTSNIPFVSLISCNTRSPRLPVVRYLRFQGTDNQEGILLDAQTKVTRCQTKTKCLPCVITLCSYPLPIYKSKYL